VLTDTAAVRGFVHPCSRKNCCCLTTVHSYIGVQMTNRGVLFVGSKQLGLRALQTLVSATDQVIGVVTFNDTEDKRSVLGKIEKYCQATGLALSVIKKPSDLGMVVEQCAPQVVFVVGWYWIIDPMALTTAPGGYFGVHASLLPKYRGNAPLVWAMLNGEERTGVSLFRLDNGIDTGDIVAQKVFSIEPSETIKDVLAKAEIATAELLLTHAREILEGKASFRKQDHTFASYCGLRRPEDGQIDWNQPAQSVYNFIRAQTRPYPGAFTITPDGQIVRIWRASIFPYPYYGVPGRVGEKYAKGVVVACGEGALVVEECEVDGQPIMPVHSVLRWGRKI